MRIKYGLASLLFMQACSYNVVEMPMTCDEPLSVEIAEIQNSSCGAENGSFSLSVNNAGSNGTVEYELNETVQESPTFEGLTGGTYTIDVTSGPCQTSIEVTVENEDGLRASSNTENSTCGSSDGKILVNVENEQGQVSFSLNGGPFQSESTFEDLQAEDYSIVVKDDSGCEVNLSVTVENDSNYSQVESIIAGSCAVSGCHAGNVSPDLRTKGNILDRAERILSRTAAGTMPPPSSGRTLTTIQKEAIECWVESGAQG